MKKFDIYASVRRLRQAAGDTAEELLAANNDEYAAWREVENLLNDAECKLEQMKVTEDD